MRIRTQLIFAFLVLSVVPLTGIVLYSFFSSQRTLRQAVEADAAAMTREMETRMAAVRDDLGRGLRRLGELPVDTLIGAAGAEDAGRNDMVARKVLGAMGDAAPLVESIEFTPDPGWASQAVTAGRAGRSNSLPPTAPSAAHPASPAHPASRTPSDSRLAAASGAAAAAPVELPAAAAAPRVASRPAAPAPPAAPGVSGEPAAGTAWAAPATVTIPLRKLLIHFRAPAGGGSADANARQVDVEQLVQEALRKAEAAQAGATRRQQELMAKLMEKRHWPVSGAPRRSTPGAAGKEAGRHPRRGSGSGAGNEGATPPGASGASGSDMAGLSPQELQELEDLGSSLPGAAGLPAGGPPALPAPPASPARPAALSGPRNPQAAAVDETGGEEEARLAEDSESTPGLTRTDTDSGSGAGAGHGDGASTRGTVGRARKPQHGHPGARTVTEAGSSGAREAGAQGAAGSREQPVRRSTTSTARQSAVEAQRSAAAAQRSAEGEKRQAPAAQRSADAVHEAADAMQRRSDQQREQYLMLGGKLVAPVREGDRVVGQVSAQVSCPIVLRAVLARSRREAGEIPFAINSQGQLYAIDKADEAKLKRLPLASLTRAGDTERARRMSAAGEDWVVVTSREPASGLILGIAHPIGRSLHEVAQTAGRNFGYGLSLIGLALIGILPLSRGMTRNLQVVTAGAERIAGGDLTTRVPVKSRSEFGQLAQAFNRMAEDLNDNQQRLIERELEQRLLRREFDRKTAELEEARRFQLALLPKTLPEHADFALAVAMRTATEVGGDYYDFHFEPAGDSGALTVAIGDATGHGARAGTMVTAIKGLLSADFAEASLSGFLSAAARAVRRMDLGRMAMALALARLSAGVLTVSSAGMPPVLLYRRRDGKVEEIALPGMPLGGMACDYLERRFEVEDGDTVLLTTDGLPELANADGDPLGYPRVRTLLAGCGRRTPEEIVAELSAAAEAWTGGQPAKDDMTMVVLQVRRGVSKEGLAAPASA
jgi:serine phosphatase RsbU (regulator of sigma subunit)